MSLRRSSHYPAPDSSAQHIAADHYECIQACHECLQACEHCASSCLAEPDVARMTRCIELDRSCADLCALAEREMLRGSPFVAMICRVCAVACEACAEECSRHAMDHCQACAAACRHCAERCHHLAEAVAGSHS